MRHKPPWRLATNPRGHVRESSGESGIERCRLPVASTSSSRSAPRSSDLDLHAAHDRSRRVPARVSTRASQAGLATPDLRCETLDTIDARGEAAEHRSRGRRGRPIAGYHREAAPVVLHMSCAACTVRFRPRRRESMTSGRTEMRRPGYDTTSSAAAATPGGARNGIFIGRRQPLAA